MKIHGVAVVQNEADVIGESIAWALRFCDTLRVWDLGSTDGTWEVLQRLESENVHSERREGLRFMSSLKGRVFASARDEMEEGSWVYILDADEFLEGDARAVLGRAESQGAARAGVWQANFFPTEKDLTAIRERGEEDWAAQPLVERLRYYRVEWFEWRFIRLVPDLVWDTSGVHSDIRRSDGSGLPAATERMAVRHYRYRSPTQVFRRYDTRQTSPVEDYGQFRYEVTSEYEACARASADCCHWDMGAPFSVPAAEIKRAKRAMTAYRIRRRLSQWFGKATVF